MQRRDVPVDLVPHFFDGIAFVLIEGFDRVNHLSPVLQNCLELFLGLDLLLFRSVDRVD